MVMVYYVRVLCFWRTCCCFWRWMGDVADRTGLLLSSRWLAGSLASRLTTRLTWRLCAPLAKEPSQLISNNRQSNHASFYHLFRRGSGRPGVCVLLLGICSFARCVRLVTLCLRRFSN